MSATGRRSPPTTLSPSSSGSSDPCRIPWAAAPLRDPRQSECLGPTWQCVDLAATVVDVSWQMQSLPWSHGCGQPATCGLRYGRGCPQRWQEVHDGHEAVHLEGAWHLTRPNTSKGQRILPLVPWMVDAMRQWEEFAPPSRHGLVWPRPDGRPQDKKVDTAGWYGLQDRAQVAHVDGKLGRRNTLHEARHTTATLLLEAGVDPETVKAILGHSDIATSRNYQHVSQALARQAMEAVVERLRLPALQA